MVSSYVNPLTNTPSWTILRVLAPNILSNETEASPSSPTVPLATFSSAT